MRLAADRRWYRCAAPPPPPQGLRCLRGGWRGAGDGFDSHINAAATLALWAFIGLESANVPAEEAKNAGKTNPMRTYELRELGTPTLTDALAPVLSETPVPAAV
jgi:hypothetical protein